MKLLTFALALASSLPAGDRVPMAANFQDSASYRWLNKPVLESRLLDDMASLDRWTAFTNNPTEIVDSRFPLKVSRSERLFAEMTLTKERSRDGRNSLRLRTPTKLEKPAPKSGRGWGESGVMRNFDGEDWRKFNRISLWIYPDCPGYYVVSLKLRFHNDGVEKLPAVFAQEGDHYVILRDHQWNHMVWEIGNVARDKVTGLEIDYTMDGNEPEAADSATYYFDHLELERVEPDYVEGWGVWPGRIAYSHAGYQSGATKSAIASGLNAGEFRLINQETGEAVLSKPIQTVNTHLGTYQVMDFSEVRQAGSYALEAGGTVTRAFRIGPDVWRETIWKALNFLYSERCGMAIPGVHGVCHRDWQVTHGDQRIIINGGWHDAGDLTQGLGNTGEIAYGLFSLAERLHARGEDPALYERLMEEAQWGLDWVLKTSFGDGFRNTGSASTRRTNGILGDFDDVVVTARNEPLANFLASAVEAIAYRTLKDRDSRLAAYCLKMAEADWRFAVAGMADADAQSSQERFHVSFDSNGVVHEAAAQGVLASVDLWRATGDQRYADKAVELGRVIVDSQERRRQAWDVPMLGFFYTSPAKDRILHYCHRGREQGPVMALAELCNAFPSHAEWMKWYSAVALYSEYLKSIAKYTEPYGVLPASIYQDDEYQYAPESRRESFRRQVLNGIPLGAGHYLRLLPVWMDYRGHFGTILPQTQALAIAAHLRGDLESEQVSQRQLEWVIGRNPFAQSAMWGEGYDFAPMYTASSGDMVGAIPVGIQSKGDRDVPYWPVQSTWTYKEVWVHPVGSWIWAMRDLAGAALVEGEAASPVEFRETSYEQRTEVIPDSSGRFRVTLPEGRYQVRSQGWEQSRTFLPGGRYSLDLRSGRAMGYEVTRQAVGGDVTIKVTAHGSGSHRFSLRADNLSVNAAGRALSLQPGATGVVEWHGRIDSQDMPWVAVVVPDDDLTQRKEVMGAVWEP